VHDAPGVDKMSSRYYLTCHLLVSYLFNRHPQELERFIAALRDDDRATAWDRVFTVVSTSDVQAGLSTFVRDAAVHVFSFQLTSDESRPQRTRPLDDVEIYALRASLFWTSGGKDKRIEVEKNLKACLAADPTHVVCNLLRVTTDPDAPVPAMDIVGRHPDDWRAWLVLAAKSRSREAQTAAMRRACDLARAGDLTATPRDVCKP
jgi:hypothetical protein